MAHPLRECGSDRLAGFSSGSAVVSYENGYPQLSRLRPRVKQIGCLRSLLREPEASSPGATPGTRFDPGADALGWLAGFGRAAVRRIDLATRYRRRETPPTVKSSPTVRSSPTVESSPTGRSPPTISLLLTFESPSFYSSYSWRSWRPWRFPFFFLTALLWGA